MFTGIVTGIGEIREARNKGDLRLVVACPFDPAKVAIGASISCSGVCLTVVDKGDAGADAWVAFDVSAETVARTVPGRWAEGTALNLEPALKMGDELGGHIVTGHVDGIATVASIEPVGDSRRFTFTVSAGIAPFLAPKGSVTLDGVSLTVNEVTDEADGTCRFTVNIIPHTGDVTTLGQLSEGDAVNVEIDVLARYLKRMQALAGSS